MLWSPRLLPTNRSNSTETATTHPLDHNSVNASSNQLNNVLGANVLGPYVDADDETFDTVEGVFKGAFRRIRDLRSYVYDVLAAQLGELSNLVSGLRADVDDLRGDVDRLEDRVDNGGGGTDPGDGGNGGGGTGGGVAAARVQVTSYDGQSLSGSGTDIDSREFVSFSNVSGRGIVNGDVVSVLLLDVTNICVGVYASYSYEPFVELA